MKTPQRMAEVFGMLLVVFFVFVGLQEWLLLLVRERWSQIYDKHIWKI